MMEFNYHISGGDFTKAGSVSSDVKKNLKQINVSPKLIKRIVVALYEAEVNVVAHAFEAKVNVKIEPEQIEITITDKGPGIEDLEKAMTEGFSTASPKVREMGFGAGMGLPNMKRNTDQLDISSTVGVGTTVKLINSLSC